MSFEHESRAPREHASSRERIADLAAKHLPMLRRFVRSRSSALLRSREPVADIVQSSVREVVEAADRCTFEDEASFRSYLRTVASHKIVSKSRYHTADQRSPGREETPSRAFTALPHATDSARSPSPSRCAAHAEELEQVRAAFASLSDEDRKILSMRRVDDIPTAEIAAALGLAESTVRWRLARALTQLASRLGTPEL